jgi:hypothetical protein
MMWGYSHGLETCMAGGIPRIRFSGIAMLSSAVAAKDAVAYRGPKAWYPKTAKLSTWTRLD